MSHSHPPQGSPAFRPTDSPWFWGLAFSLMALVGLAVIAPRFAWRQGQLERRFLGREQAALERHRRLDGRPAVDLAEHAVEPPGVRGAGERPIVPLWTLASLAGLAAVGSAAMLFREARTAGRRHP
jgi:hypothetical protein